VANMGNKANPNPKRANRSGQGTRPDIDNDHQKTVQGKNQRGPADKVGRDAGGHEGSRGQNVRGGLSGSTGKNGPSVGSHKPGGDGPGTKKFKHEHDDDKRRKSRS
jgi:hypothetical protein